MKKFGKIYMVVETETGLPCAVYHTPEDVKNMRAFATIPFLTPVILLDVLPEKHLRKPISKILYGEHVCYTLARLVFHSAD